MKIVSCVASVLVCFLFVGTLSAQTESVPATLVYGDFKLPAGFTSTAMPGTWNLTAAPVKITYTADLRGAPNVNFDWNWSNMAIVGLFGSGAGARMVGFLSDWDNPSGVLQFPSFPDKPGTLDNDDKFNLQRFPNPGSYSEGMYDVNCADNTVAATPIGSGNNYGIWGDRDGVDQWQDDMWGMVDGGTYNTNGIYPVELLFRKTSSTKGTVCSMLSPQLANPWVSGFGIQTGFYTGWVSTGPQIYPAGLSFDTDDTKMAAMQVLVEGASGAGEIWVKDLTVSGMLVLVEGMATGGGWYIPDLAKPNKLTVSGAKATFGFSAKQKDGSSSGQLQFVYHGDNLSLTSTGYDWASVANTQVMFEGVGELTTPTGAVPNVKFRVAASDADKTPAITDSDHFLIRIWTGDENDPIHLSEGDLGGGQIVVHKK